MDKKVRIAAAGAICAAAVGLTAFALTRGNDSNDDKPSETSVIVTTEAPTDPTEIALPDNWADDIKYVPSPTGMTPRAKLFLEKYNPDVIGWIRLHGTVINYPVLLDPGATPEDHPFYGPESHKMLSYYLDHDLDRSYKRSGSIYIDCRDVIGSDETQFSENIVIYGHNMLDETMFGALRRYRQNSYLFYDEAPFFQFSTNYKTDDYVIFAFLKTYGSYEDTDFYYWNQEELDTKEEFDTYVNRCRRDQMIDTGIDVQFGDQIITLSTCYSDEDNSRFIVVARKLRPGETASDLDSIAHTKEWLDKKKKEEASNATTEKSDNDNTASVQ